MDVSDPVITLAFFLKLEFPDGDVRLCDGAFLDFGGERYEADHPVFGTVKDPGSIEDGFGDMAESGSLVLVPNPEAAVASWWRNDLFDCRMRAWLGEVDTDGKTVSSARLLHDLLVDSYQRVQGAGGEDLLELSFIGRNEKFFLTNQGNVCSDRFHRSLYSGETGFAHCTDVTGFVAWGTERPPRGTGGRGGAGAREILRQVLR